MWSRVEYVTVLHVEVFNCKVQKIQQYSLYVTNFCVAMNKLNYGDCLKFDLA